MTINLDRRATRAACRHAVVSLPFESCGLFAGPIGAPGHIDHYCELTNQAKEPDHYLVDPVDFLRATEQITRSGRHIMGFVHSHPSGPVHLSPADLKHAWPDYLQFLLTRTSDRFDRIRIFDAAGVALQSIPVRALAGDHPPR